MSGQASSGGYGGAVAPTNMGPSLGSGQSPMMGWNGQGGGPNMGMQPGMRGGNVVQPPGMANFPPQAQGTPQYGMPPPRQAQSGPMPPMGQPMVDPTSAGGNFAPPGLAQYIARLQGR